MKISELRKAPPARASLRLDAGPSREDGIRWLPASRVRPKAGGDRLILSLSIATAAVLAAAAGIATWDRRSDVPPALIRAAPTSPAPPSPAAPSKEAGAGPAPASSTASSTASWPAVPAPPVPALVPAASAPPAPALLEALAPPAPVIVAPEPASSRSPASESPAPPDQPAPAPRPPVAPGARAAVYLDPYPDQKSAAAALRGAQAKFGPYIGANRLTYARRNGGAWRLRVGNLDTEAAEAICARVRAAGHACAVGPN